MIHAMFGTLYLIALALVGVALAFGFLLRRQVGLNGTLWLGAYLAVGLASGLATPVLTSHAVDSLVDLRGSDLPYGLASVGEGVAMLGGIHGLFAQVAALVIGLLLVGDAVRLLERANIRTESGALRALASMSRSAPAWGAAALCVHLLGPVLVFLAGAHFASLAARGGYSPLH